MCNIHQVESTKPWLQHSHQQQTSTLSSEYQEVSGDVSIWSLTQSIPLIIYFLIFKDSDLLRDSSKYGDLSSRFLYLDIVAKDRSFRSPLVPFVTNSENGKDKIYAKCKKKAERAFFGRTGGFFLKIFYLNRSNGDCCSRWWKYSIYYVWESASCRGS